MGKWYREDDLEGARDRVIEAAIDAVEARDDDFPEDELGRLGDAVMWLRMVQRNVEDVKG